MQTKLGSLAETCVNIVIGFSISFTANLYVLPWFGFPVSKGQAFWIGVVYTIISLIRGYWLRRFFDSIAWGNIRQGLDHERDSAGRAE